MAAQEITGIYGTQDLVAAPPGAIQFSPLIPGSMAFEEASPASLHAIVVAAPPGTVERRYVLALALRALRPGGALTALAPRNRGGLRLRKDIESFGVAVEEETRAHARICRAVRPRELCGIDAVLAAGGPQFSAATGLWTQAGIFSWDRIDPGSALLAAHLPALAGAGADLGAGNGYLARAILASPSVGALALIELDRRAIEAARRNVTDPRASFHWQDALAPSAITALDFVVTNPPFHRGGMEDKALGLAVARAAAAILRPGGVLYLVANRHLPYAPTLREHFAKVEIAGEDSAFRVYRALR